MNTIEQLRQVQTALEQYTRVVSSVNDPSDFTAKIKDEGASAREALTLIPGIIAAVEQPTSSTQNTTQDCLAEEMGKPASEQPVDWDTVIATALWDAVGALRGSLRFHELDPHTQQGWRSTVKIAVDELSPYLRPSERKSLNMPERASSSGAGRGNDAEMEAGRSDKASSPIPSERESGELAAYMKAVSTLFDAIKHGDQEHQDWLRDAIAAHFEIYL